MTDAPAVPARAEKGRSLWYDAFRRLRKNRLAMIGLVVTSLVALSAILAPWISPFPPESPESWFSNQPPRSSHESLASIMVFRLGESPSYPEEAAGAETAVLELLIDPGKETKVGVGIRKGKVRHLIVDGSQIKEKGYAVEARAEEEGFYVLTGQEKAGDPYDFRRIEIGQDCPPALADSERDQAGFNKFVFLKAKEFPEPQILRVEFEDGHVSRIELAGEEPAERTVRPWDVEDARLDGEPHEHGHLLGTDKLGRDLLSRLIYGGRISLLVGFVATLVSLVVGVTYGAIAGYAGGRVDQILMRIVDILYALPYMFLVILLLVFFGRNIVILFIALGAVQWLTMSRIVRGQVLSLKQKEFIEAARACGAGHARTLFTHLIPNVLGVVAVYTTLTVPAVILQEAFLSFIGLKVEFQGRDLESWGSLVDLGVKSIDPRTLDYWWLLVFPGVTLAISLLCMNFLGDGLRDALDPRQKGRT
ncbi:MAG: ABC transporter permease [Planctomycetes bacterium]|nr:ABC transporter permease [Planctomycetota bacterium]